LIPIHPDRSHLILGCAYALGSAALFGTITTFAKLSYLHGANPISVIALRFWFAAMVLVAVFRLTRRPWRPDLRARWSLLGVGLGWFVATLGYLSSVHYMPVSLAALVFYTFPLLVGAFASWTGSVAVSPRYLAGFSLAFCGLALALGPSMAGLDWRGVALALVGATGAASTFVFGARATRGNEPLVVSLYMNLLCAVLVSAVVVAGGAPAWPQTSFGWSVLCIAAVLFVLAVSAQFFSLRHIPPATSAVVFNLEPFITIAMAWLLLGEQLSGVQCVGAALVVTGITLVTRNASQPAAAQTRS
jgi:drug/metabolite transporter (DMT)-like permease